MTDQGLNDAERRFTELFLRTSDVWAVVKSFRTVFDVGLPLAVESLALETRRSVQEQLARPAGKSIFIKDKMTPAIAEEISASLSSGLTKSAQNSLDAACFVFIHTMVDSAAIDCCRLSADLAPGDWFEVVKSRKVPMQDIRGVPFESVLMAAVSKYLDQLERESILTKIDRLHVACPDPIDPELRIRGYTFDRQRLARLDKLRHEIIHADGLGRPIANVLEELDFLQKTASHLLVMVGVKFGLRIDSRFVRTYYMEKAAARNAARDEKL